MKIYLLLFLFLLTEIGCVNQPAAKRQAVAKYLPDDEECVIALTFQLGLNSDHILVGSDIRIIYQTSRMDKGLSGAIDRDGMEDILLDPICVKRLYEYIVTHSDTTSPAIRNKGPLLKIDMFSFENSDFRKCYYYEIDDVRKFLSDVALISENVDSCSVLAERIRFIERIYK